MTLSFPPEILSAILANLSLDYSSLLSAALVSHFWNACTNTIFYGFITLSWNSRMKPLLRAVDSRPTLLPLPHPDHRHE